MKIYNIFLIRAKYKTSKQYPKVLQQSNVVTYLLITYSISFPRLKIDKYNDFLYPYFAYLFH